MYHDYFFFFVCGKLDHEYLSSENPRISEIKRSICMVSSEVVEFFHLPVPPFCAYRQMDLGAGYHSFNHGLEPILLARSL